jgi:hypothetical protein
MNSTSQLTDHPTLEVSYREELRNVLLSELRTRPTEFESLVGRAEGAYPADVMTVLRTLEADNEVSESDGVWFLFHQIVRPRPTPLPRIASTSGFFSDLPEPHPLDFDWRFTESTLRDFENLVNLTNTASGAILGAPSLYKHLSDLGASVSLFDKNPQIVEYLRSVGYSTVNEVDLTRSSEFSAQFHWGIADPPWYPEHYEGFMSAASQLIRPGGKLLLSVLPRLTRPSATSDRFFIIEAAQNLGFDLVEILPGALLYASPPFELEALREEGLLLGNWRKGDLFSFILSSRRRIESDLPQSDDSYWRTIPLGTTTVRIKSLPVDESEAFSYRAASSAGTSRLRSVSRRSPIRSEINVWTSRNIALIVSRPRILSDALTAIVDGTLPTQALSAITTTYGLNDSGARQLREVLELVLRDAGLPWE